MISEKNKNAAAGGLASTKAAISVSGLSKSYESFARPSDRLLNLARRSLPLPGGLIRTEPEKFTALRDISFEVEKGGVLGVIGRNGAGKSTLLQILAGISAPDGGSVKVRGKIGAILELGGSFHPDFSGRRNVLLAGAILGFSRRAILERMDEIRDFAEIGDFFDRPVRTYSSGMFLRLAFSVNACLVPDVLLVDEVLAVGDIYFQQKCHAKMAEMIALGTTVVLVSHFMKTIEQYAGQVLLLDEGRSVFLGKPLEAMDAYHQLVSARDRNDRGRKMRGDSAGAGAEGGPAAGGSCPVKPKCIGIYDESGAAKSVFTIGETAVFNYEFEALEDLANPAGGVRITNDANLHIHFKGSGQNGECKVAFARRGSLLRFRQTVLLSLAPGTYSFSIYVGEFDAQCMGGSDPDTLTVITQAGSFDVFPASDTGGLPFYDLVDLPGSCVLEVEPPGAG